jgi:hypothetical protein
VQPRLDHLIGRAVEKISTHEKQSALCLEDGFKIIITDKRAKWDSGLVGQRFISVEDYYGDGVRLLFNQDEEVVAKDKLLIYSPDHDDTFDPFATYETEIPPDPSPDRLREGPDENNEEA